MNKDNHTLIILTPGFPKDMKDTTCLPFLQNFILELKEQFPLLQVVVLAFDYPLIKAGYQWHTTQVYSFNGWKKAKIKKLFTWLLIFNRMKKIKLSSHVIGVLSLWCGECAFLGRRFANRNHIKHYCWLQGQDAKKDNKYVNRIKPLSEELVAISDFIQAEFEKNHKIRPKYVIPMGIRPAEYRMDNSSRDVDILGVGSLIPLKQYHLFIEVIEHVRKDFPHIHAVLCGKGQEENELKRRIQRGGLQEHITLAGELPHEEILQIMRRSRIFLHTSSYEGISVVCNEALYAGCHVISFVQLMHYTIEHWNVVQTMEQMIEKVRVILDNPGTIYNSVVTFTSAENVKRIIGLFHYKE